MAKLTYSEMLAGLYDLNREELHDLNAQLIVIARSKSREIRQESAHAVINQQKFQLGDVVSFFKSGHGRNAGMNYFIFDNLNRNRDCMQGRGCDSNGVPFPVNFRWTVTLTQETAKVHMRGGKKV